MIKEWPGTKLIAGAEGFTSDAVPNDEGEIANNSTEAVTTPPLIGAQHQFGIRTVAKAGANADKIVA
jgi:hypothetical protein